MTRGRDGDARIPDRAPRIALEARRQRRSRRACRSSTGSGASDGEGRILGSDHRPRAPPSGSVRRAGRRAPASPSRSRPTSCIRHRPSIDTYPAEVPDAATTASRKPSPAARSLASVVIKAPNVEAPQAVVEAIGQARAAGAGHRCHERADRRRRRTQRRPWQGSRSPSTARAPTPPRIGPRSRFGTRSCRPRSARVPERRGRRHGR